MEFIPIEQPDIYIISSGASVGAKRRREAKRI